MNDTKQRRFAAFDNHNFGRYFLGGDYDVYLAPIIDVSSNLPEDQHDATVHEFTKSMLALGFPLAK